MEFLFKNFSEFFYFASFKEEALSAAEQAAEKADELDRIASDKIEVYGGSFLDYIYNDLNLNKIVAWIPHHLISTLLIFGLVFLIIKKITAKRDKVADFLNHINQDITKISSTVDRINSLSKEEIDYLEGNLEEIANDLRFMKYQMFHTENYLGKYQNQIKEMGIITSDMVNRVQSGKAADKLIPKISQLKKIIGSYSAI